MHTCMYVWMWLSTSLDENLIIFEGDPMTDASVGKKRRINIYTYFGIPIFQANGRNCLD